MTQKDVLIVLPDSARQGLKYEINGIADDSIYVNDWNEAVKIVKKKYPSMKKVQVMTNMGNVYNDPI